MKLSPNFTLAELSVTDTGLVNSPTVEALSNLAKLTTTILQPLRDMLGKKVYVNSGYRSVEVNKRVGGEALSAHLTGRAADIWVAGMTPYQLAKFIQDSGLPYDKVIQEPSWVHVQIAKEGREPRGQEILARRVNGKMQYTFGLSEAV